MGRIGELDRPDNPGFPVLRWPDAILAESEIPDVEDFRETGFYLAPDQERTGLDPGFRYPGSRGVQRPSQSSIP